jgi:hypothetical protein
VAEVETVMLANHAEAMNGLLYVSGGGWSHHWRGPRPGGQPAPSQVAFAATITASATETVGEIPFIVLINGAGAGEIMRATGTMTIGSGDAKSQRRAALAGNFGIAFPGEGRYELTVEIPGSRRTVEFWVHDQAMPATPGPPGAPATGTPPGPETTRGYI